MILRDLFQSIARTRPSYLMAIVQEYHNLQMDRVGEHHHLFLPCLYRWIQNLSNMETVKFFKASCVVVLESQYQEEVKISLRVVGWVVGYQITKKHSHFVPHD